MAFVVVYDACVLYPAPLRDLLLRVARTGIVRARSVRGQLTALRNPPQTVSQLLDTLRGNGLEQTVTRLEELLAN